MPATSDTSRSTDRRSACSSDHSRDEVQRATGCGLLEPAIVTARHVCETSRRTNSQSIRPISPAFVAAAGEGLVVRGWDAVSAVSSAVDSPAPAGRSRAAVSSSTTARSALHPPRSALGLPGRVRRRRFPGLSGTPGRSRLDDRERWRRIASRAEATGIPSIRASERSHRAGLRRSAARSSAFPTGVSGRSITGRPEPFR